MAKVFSLKKGWVDVRNLKNISHPRFFEYKFFLHKCIENDEGYAISEKETGAIVVRGVDVKETIKNFKERMDTLSKEDMDKEVEKMKKGRIT
jgi:hypothetical protein